MISVITIIQISFLHFLGIKLLRLPMSSFLTTKVKKKELILSVFICVKRTKCYRKCEITLELDSNAIWQQRRLLNKLEARLLTLIFHRFPFASCLAHIMRYYDHFFLPKTFKSYKCI